MQTHPTTPISFRPMEQDGGSSAANEMIPDGNGGSIMAAPEAKMIKRKAKHELVPQLRFPSGYHFLPTDLELVDFYLRRKIEGQKLPLDIFMEVNLLDWEPEKLVAERKAYGEDTYFFFTVRKDSPCNKPGQPRRKLEVEGVKASWKATGSVAKICRPGTDEVIGTRRMLTYSCGHREDDKYSMFEYILTSRSEMDQWVLCTIKEKQNWNADQNKDKNASSGKDKMVNAREDKKRKRGTDTLEPKTTKRKKKTATSQPQETQEQQQEIMPDTSSDPLPLLRHEQDDHRQALQDEEGVMTFEWPSPVIQAVAPHEYPVGGDEPHYHDASMQQEAMPWDVPGEPPLMKHQQHGYQASEQFMLEQFTAMFQCQGQQQLDNTHEFSLYGYGSMPYLLLQHPFQYALTTQGFHGDITATLQPDSGKAPETSPSPDSVLRGPDPELPSGDARPYSDSDAGMMNGVSPTMGTNYGPAADYRYNPADLQGHNFDDNLAGSGDSSHVAMGLPGQGSNQALHMCPHGIQWLCGEQQCVM